MKKRRWTTEDWIINIFVYVVMIGFTLTILYPFWYLLVDSFNTPTASIKDQLKLWPKEFTTINYIQVFDNDIVGTAYINTIIKTIAGTSLILIVCFMAAFGLADKRIPFLKPLTFFMILTMFFGGGLIPTYLWYKQLGLINTRLVWILPGLANAYYIIIMRNFFRNIPAELTECAVIDGATMYQVLFRVIVPLSTPVIATVGLWAAVAHWNGWFMPMIMAPRKDLTVLQVLLRRILVENQMTQMMDLLEEDEARQTTEETIKAALLYVTIGPIVLIYPFVQRYFVKGIMTGSVKG
jgi:ABC-type glycerol-3-phosphate transport system permease component